MQVVKKKPKPKLSSLNLGVMNDLNLENYVVFHQLLKQQPDMFKLLLEYKNIMSQNELSNSDLERISELLEKGSNNKLFGQSISNVDELLQGLYELDGNRISLEDFVFDVRTTPKKEMTEKLFLQLAQRVRISDKNLSSYIKFKDSVPHDSTPNRELILSSQECCVYCICWKPGQRTSFHQHPNTFGAVFVKEGVLTITDHEIDSQKQIKTTKVDKYSKGKWLSSSRHQLHRLSNVQQSNLITLHFKYYVNDPTKREVHHPRCLVRDKNPDLYDNYSVEVK